MSNPAMRPVRLRPPLPDLSASQQGFYRPGDRHPRRAVLHARASIHSRASVLNVPASSDQSQSSRSADAQGILPPVLRFLLTLALVVFALASVGAVAFGTHPALAQYPSGLAWITFARRLQWPLISVCLVLCVTLIGLVVVGKRHVLWLICLAPILFLFYQRFAWDEFRRMAVLDNPPFVTPDKAGHVKPDSPVIGLVVEGQPMAYPCGALALAPVIVHSDADKRVMVMYSPYAGRAQAFIVDNTIKPRELDIVSMPADALLIYNSRIGQFINGFTGTTVNGGLPEGFHSTVDVRKTTWRSWLNEHPDTLVLATAVSASLEKPKPRFPPMPVKMDLPAESRVSVLHAVKPVIVESSKFSPSAVFNITAGGTNLLLFRDKATGQLRAYDRAVKGDLFPKFIRKSVPKKPEVAFYDADTDSLWNGELHCIAGNVKGEQLHPVTIEEDVAYGTLKSSFPNLETIKP